MNQVPEAWASYRDWPGAQATLSDDSETPSFDEREVDEMLARSDALASSIRGHLEADEPEERELAALQLQAAAAVDIERANALAAADEGLAPEAVLADESFSILDRILSTPTENGISAVLANDDDDGGGLLATATEPGTFKQAVNEAIDKIADDAGRAATTTASGLIGMAAGELMAGLNTSVEGAFDAVVDKVSWLKKKAVTLVLKAVQKLLAVFGTKTEGLRAEVQKWIDDLEKGVIKALLARLYQIEALKQRFGSRIDGATVPENREQTARDELAKLQAKWHLRTEVINTMGHIASYARLWIVALAPPYGAIAYGAGFGLATGYVVFAGGDYLDWHEGGLLDMVKGVGAIVDGAVGPSPAPPLAPAPPRA